MSFEELLETTISVVAGSFCAFCAFIIFDIAAR